VVQCYNARLKFIANVAAATTITASEKRKQCKSRETGKLNIGCSAQKDDILTF